MNKLNLNLTLTVLIFLWIILSVGCTKPTFKEWLTEHMQTCKTCHTCTKNDTYELCPEAWRMSHPKNSN